MPVSWRRAVFPAALCVLQMSASLVIVAFDRRIIRFYCNGMETVRIGVIGLGNMGMFHVGSIESLTHVKLTAVCDAAAGPGRRRSAPGTALPTSRVISELLDSGTVDAVLIATPHLQHPEICLAAFAKNIHVLSEKPIAITIRQAREVNQDAAGPSASEICDHASAADGFALPEVARADRSRESWERSAGLPGLSPTGSAPGLTTAQEAGAPPGRERAAAC